MAYHGENVRDKWPGAPNGLVAEDLYAEYSGDLEDGDWVVIDPESALGGAVAAHAREIRKSFCRIQQAQRETGMEVLRNLF